MSNPRRPSFKHATPVEVERDLIPPCPELRDMRLTRPPMTEEEAAMNWAAMNAGHSEGLAGSGGMLPERLDRGGWPILDGAITRTGYSPGASTTGYPVSGHHAFAPAPAYPPPWGYPTNPAYPPGSGQASYVYPQGGNRPRGSGYPQDGSSAGGRAARGGRS
ncbi:hypothetical protein RhiJN_25562 [Ceratobasidium sp. AG-Ba]|nr:hypothetical protein RhiJN_25562 [Ceratobasidium sp. AG-Ba]